MNFKVIHLTNDELDVLVARAIDEEGTQVVDIRAFVFDNADDEIILESKVKFKNGDDAERFVKDYSGVSAAQFVREGLLDQGIKIGGVS